MIANPYASQELMRLPFGDGSLVLFDPTSSNEATIRNLVKVDKSDRLIWVAQLPTSHDSYINVEISAGLVRAWTFGGYCVELDSETGIVMRSSFVK